MLCNVTVQTSKQILEVLKATADNSDLILQRDSHMTKNMIFFLMHVDLFKECTTCSLKGIATNFKEPSAISFDCKAIGSENKEPEGVQMPRNTDENS